MAITNYYGDSFPFLYLYFGCRLAYSWATFSIQGHAFWGFRSWCPTITARG